MLDFVLNLLIFFIIIAVFVKESSLMVNRPTGEQATQSESTSIPIQILANSEIWIEGRAVDLRAVRANVERMYAVTPKSGVLIIADREAPTGLLVQVVDQVHLGNVYNITFSTARVTRSHGVDRSAIAPTHPEQEDHGIDLAPMLDFVLNLLIFFIITTSFVKEAGVVVTRPGATTAEQRESGNILCIRENGEVLDGPTPDGHADAAACARAPAHRATR
jgi:biopolymer transport protein ExbD